MEVLTVSSNPASSRVLVTTSRRAAPGIWAIALLVACSPSADLPTAITARTDGSLENRGQPNLITVAPASAGLAVDQTLQLATVVTNKHGIVQPDRPVAFASSDPAIAPVSASGLVTARAPGWVDVVASTGGSKPLEAVARISVGPAVVATITPFVGGLTTSLGQADFAVVGDYPHVSFACRVNGREVACDPTLRWNDRGLVTGDVLTIEITAFTLDIDPPAAGPTTMARAEIENQPPSIVVLTPIQGSTVGKDILFQFSSDDLAGEFYCALDGNAFPCTPGLDAGFAGLWDGMHAFTIEAVDVLGNTNSQSILIAVDASPPVWDPSALRVPSVPVGPASTGDTEIRFMAVDPNPPVTYYCSLDGSEPAPCSAISPAEGVFRWSSLAAGTHQLRVSAFDVFRNRTEELLVAFVIEDL